MNVLSLFPLNSNQSRNSVGRHAWGQEGICENGCKDSLCDSILRSSPQGFSLLHPPRLQEAQEPGASVNGKGREGKLLLTLTWLLLSCSFLIHSPSSLILPVQQAGHCLTVLSPATSQTPLILHFLLYL